MKVYAWLIDFAHFRENCPTGIIPEWMQKVTRHNGIIQSYKTRNGSKRDKEMNLSYCTWSNLKSERYKRSCRSKHEEKIPFWCGSEMKMFFRRRGYPFGARRKDRRPGWRGSWNWKTYCTPTSSATRRVGRRIPRRSSARFLRGYRPACPPSLSI